MLSSLKKETSYVSSKYSTSTLGKGKSPLVWAIISGETPPKPRVLPAWGGVGRVIDRCMSLKPTIHDATCNVQHAALNLCMHHIATMLHVKLAVNVISVRILVVITCALHTRAAITRAGEV